MKIKEILAEDDIDQDNDGASPHIEQMKNELVNYLSSLNATGAMRRIPTEKMVIFLRRMGFNATPEQIVDLLSDTAFGADPENIDPEGNAIQDKGPDPEFNKKKVSNMANQEIQRGLRR